MTSLFDIHHGEYVGVDSLVPGLELCVTVREDGELQIWNMTTGKQVSAMPIGLQVNSVL